MYIEYIFIYLSELGFSFVSFVSKMLAVKHCATKERSREEDEE